MRACDNKTKLTRKKRKMKEKRRNYNRDAAQDLTSTVAATFDTTKFTVVWSLLPVCFENNKTSTFCPRLALLVIFKYLGILVGTQY